MSVATTTGIAWVTAARADRRPFAGADLSVNRVRPPEDGSAAAVAERALRSDPACVVCDHRPGAGVDGLAVLRAVRALDRSVPVVLWTPEPDGRAASEATALDVDAYVHGDGLCDAVRETLETARDPVDHQRYLDELHRLLSDHGGEFRETADRLLALGCDYLGVDIGFVTTVADGQQSVVHARGDDPALQPGGVAPVEESYCRFTVDDGGPVAFDDASTTLAGDPAYERFGLGCYLGATVEVGGETYGTLCFADEEPRDRSFSPAERRFVDLAGDWFGRELERRSLEDQTRAARVTMENVLERIDDGFFALDEEGRFSYVNGRAAALLDADPDDLLGAAIDEVYDTPEARPFLEQYQRAMEHQEPVSFEEYFEPLGLWFDVSAYPDEGGLSVYFGDITERKRRESMLDGLLDTTRRLMAADGAAAVADVVVDAARDVLEFDYVAVRLYDEEADALELVSWTETVDEEMPTRPTYDVDEGHVGRAFTGGESFETAVDLGSVTAARYIPLGEFGVISVGAADPGAFDELRRGVLDVLAANAVAGLERAGRESTLRQYERVLETVKDMVYVLDEHGRFDYVTEPLASFLGYDRAALLDEHPAAFVAEGDTAQVRRRIDGLVAGDDRDDSTFEIRVRTACGDEVPVQVDSAVLTGADDERFAGTVGVVRDISDLKRTREELEAENARFRNLFQHIPDPVAEARFEDGEPIVTRVNQAFERVFGYESETVVGGSLNDLIVPEGERDRARRLDTRSTEEPVVTEEVTRLTATGERDFLFRGVSYERDDGTRAGYAIYTDISDQKDRQRRLEVLHTVLRHNLRTELTLARGYADQLAAATESETAEKLHDAITEIENVSAKARTLERVVADESVPAATSTDVVARVREVIARCRERHADVTIRTVLPDRVDAVADYRLDLALENLVENAVEHGSTSPRSQAHGDAVEHGTEGEAHEILVSVRDGGSAVTVAVCDDGPGIPAHERALIAGDRDITQLEHGSGLGLWIVATAVRSLGGELTFRDPPSGAAVELHLHPA